MLLLALNNTTDIRKERFFFRTCSIQYNLSFILSLCYWYLFFIPLIPIKCPLGIYGKCYAFCDRFFFPFGRIVVHIRWKRKKKIETNVPSFAFVECIQQQKVYLMHSGLHQIATARKKKQQNNRKWMKRARNSNWKCEYWLWVQVQRKMIRPREMPFGTRFRYQIDRL